MSASPDSRRGRRAPAGGPVAAEDLGQRLEQLNAVGASLSAERNIDRLLEAILTAAKTITRADGGTLYRLTEDKSLRFEIVRTSSLSYYLGGTSGNPVPFYPIQLYKDGNPNHGMVAAYAALTGETVNIADAYAADGFDFSGTRAFDAKTGYRSKSFLTVPMRNHDNEIIGVLQLINAQDPRRGEIVPFAFLPRAPPESAESNAVPLRFFPLHGLRGTAAHRWPVPAILGSGCALIVACYGSWVPDDPEAWPDRLVARGSAMPSRVPM